MGHQWLRGDRVRTAVRRSAASLQRNYLERKEICSMTSAFLHSSANSRKTKYPFFYK